MDSETRQILEMTQQGKITPEEATRLLDALEPGPGRQANAKAERSLRIHVADMRTGRPRVNLNLPLRLVEVAGRMGLTLGLKQAPELANVDFDEIMAAITAGASGNLIDIEDAETRQHLVISLE